MTVLENNLMQAVEALTCPVNRFATMREHSCNEYELFLHPEWLIEHYAKYGGAEAFAKRRGLQREPEYNI
jgi:hypothetical protein